MAEHQHSHWTFGDDPHAKGSGKFSHEHDGSSYTLHHPAKAGGPTSSAGHFSEPATVGDTVKGGPWDGFEVVSVYGDSQAVEDGVLVKFDGPFIGGPPPEGKMVNLVTRPLFSEYTDELLGGAMINVTKLSRLLERIVSDARVDDGWLIYDGPDTDKTIWVVPNEVDGYTAMFAEDY